MLNSALTSFQLFSWARWFILARAYSCLCVFAIVLAFLLLPVNNWLVKRGMPQVPSMLLSILFAVLFIAGIVYFISSQVAHFADDIPKIKQNLNHHLNTVQQWIRENFNISKREQNAACTKCHTRHEK